MLVGLQGCLKKQHNEDNMALIKNYFYSDSLTRPRNVDNKYVCNVENKYAHIFSLPQNNQHIFYGFMTEVVINRYGSSMVKNIWHYNL
jgi:hypothetical protein